MHRTTAPCSSRTSRRALCVSGCGALRPGEFLEPLANADLSNDGFPYMRARELSIGSVPCLALRVTYVGELGWELYCPMEYGLRLWDTIWEAGREERLVAGGYKAIDSSASRRATACGVPTSPRRRRLTRRGSSSPSSSTRASSSAATPPRSGRQGPRAPARLPRARRSALGRARLRAGADRRGPRRPRDERRLRLHRGAVDRLCLHAGGGRGAGTSPRGRDLRRMGGGRGRGRALWDPSGERIR